jgi:hypothetical protein
LPLLPSFEVENFRTFSHLQIPRLGGVNLIVGRNNVGKTTLLEALRLYAAEGNINAAIGLLYDRDEMLSLPGTEAEQRGVQVRFASLFHGWRQPEDRETTICLQTDSDDPRRLRIGVGSRSYPWPRATIDSGSTTTTTPPPLDREVVLPVLTVKVGDAAEICYPMVFGLPPGREAWSVETQRLALAFVPANGVDSKTLARQWDAIALRKTIEEQVIECLRIVAPIERITSVEHPANPRQRMFLARIEGTSEPVPLRSLGDGMVRMFQLALALESAKTRHSVAGVPPRSLIPDVTAGELDGVFLIDEIENGIHHTVLPDLWRFLFRTAKVSNVQVFATTHSRDCAEAFQTVAAEEKETSGTLIRLERSVDRNRAVTFSESELAIVTRDWIEVR